MTTFSTATVKDLPKMNEIYSRTFNSIQTIGQAPTEEWLLSQEKKKKQVWLIKQQEQLLGWMTMIDYHTMPGYSSAVEFDIYADPDHSLDCYTATTLEFLLDQAHALDLNAIVTYISEEDTRANEFFANNHFQIWGKFPHFVQAENRLIKLNVYGRHC